MANTITVGARIEHLREASGLTRSALAAKTNMTEQAIRNIELGARTGKLGTLRVIAAALGVAIEDVVRGTT